MQPEKKTLPKVSNLLLFPKIPVLYTNKIFTDDIGIIDKPLADEVICSYPARISSTIVEKKGKGALDDIFFRVARIHLGDTYPPSMLKSKVLDSKNSINGLLYLALIENMKYGLGAEHDDNFYFDIGEREIREQNQWISIVGDLITFETLYSHFAKTVPNFTKLITLTLEDVSKKDGLETIIISRKTKPEYVERLSNTFDDNIVKTILKNDCNLTRGIITTIPLMYKHVRDLQFHEDSCEGTGSNYCIYRLERTYKKAELIHDLKNRVKIFLPGTYFEYKDGLEKIMTDYSERKTKADSLSKDLHLITEQIETLNNDILKYMKEESITSEYRRRLSNIVSKKKSIGSFFVKPVPDLDFAFKKKWYVSRCIEMERIIFSAQNRINRVERSITDYDNMLHNKLCDLDTMKAEFFDILKDAHERGRLEEVISFTTKILEDREPGTAGHSARVARYAVKIGKEYGLNEKNLALLEISALMHDLGKIFIPGSILNKKEKLNDMEFDIIKKHPEDSGHMVGRLEYLDTTLVPIIKNCVSTHHVGENCGYPSPKHYFYGTKTALANILSVADAIDAMQSRRSYKDSYDQSFVINELDRCKGTQFNAEISEFASKFIIDGNLPITTITTYKPKYIHNIIRDW